jgi:hypothetical protein
MKTLTLLYQEGDIFVLGDAEGNLSCCRLVPPASAESTEVMLPLAAEPRPEWMEKLDVQPPYARLRDTLTLQPVTLEELPGLTLYAAFDKPTGQWFVYIPKR